MRAETWTSGMGLSVGRGGDNGPRKTPSLEASGLISAMFHVCIGEQGLEQYPQILASRLELNHLPTTFPRILVPWPGLKSPPGP